MSIKFKETLCWHCENAVGGCPWSDSFTPVKGWTAEKIEATKSRPFTSCNIIECPMFVRDKISSKKEKN